MSRLYTNFYLTNNLSHFIFVRFSQSSYFFEYVILIRQYKLNKETVFWQTVLIVVHDIKSTKTISESYGGLKNSDNDGAGKKKKNSFHFFAEFSKNYTRRSPFIQHFIELS